MASNGTVADRKTEGRIVKGDTLIGPPIPDSRRPVSLSLCRSLLLCPAAMSFSARALKRATLAVPAQAAPSAVFKALFSSSYPARFATPASDAAPTQKPPLPKTFQIYRWVRLPLAPVFLHVSGADNRLPIPPEPGQADREAQAGGFPARSQPVRPDGPRCPDQDQERD
jgi:hypothetical protein